LTNDIPFSEYTNDAQVIFAIMTGNTPTRRASAADCPEAGNDSRENIWQLLQRCWDRDPSQRPMTDEIKHFLAGLKVSDNRPPVASDEELQLTMAEAKKAACEVEVNYNRVCDILLRVSEYICSD
jgi:hypothetical protein